MREANESLGNVTECVCFVLYDLFWPFILWLSPLLLLLSLSECLSLTDFGCNPLQRPITPWPWERSCGFALPPDPPWKLPRKPKRTPAHFSLIQREQRRFGSVKSWFYYVRQEELDLIPWEQDLSTTSTTPQALVFHSKEVDDLLERLDPLEYYQRFSTLTSSSFLSTMMESNHKKQVLVAAADLRSSFKATKSNPLVLSDSNPYILNAVDDTNLPIVVDTGASISVTPNIGDFVGPIKTSCCGSLQGLGDTTRVDGEGIMEWQIRDVLGTVRTIRTHGYLVKSAKVRLFSPQTYFKEAEISSASLYVDHQRTELTLHDGSLLTFPFAENNIPYMLTDWQPIVGITLQDQPMMTDQTSINMSVAHETNQNLSQAQKELLGWHWKLGHCNFSWVQRLASDPRSEKRRRVLTATNQISTVKPPFCAACLLSKIKRKQPPGSVGGKPPPSMQIRSGDLQPGQCVSVDQYVSSVPGRLPNTMGKEPSKLKYHGGTIFVDHASSFIFLVNQSSLRVGETLQSKIAFERFAQTCGHKIKSFRADNMPFASKEFQADLDTKEQEITFSGVGAHHQNGVAERAIQTVTQWARSMLLHQALHWPDQTRLDLWPFALEHAVYLWNHLPRKDSLLAPMELFSGATFDNFNHIQRARVWGCPVYVLDPKLQDGNKIPKWDPRSRRGMFVGVSQSHSSTVGRIMNLRTGNVSPQYHAVYDDLFTTVPNAESGGLVEQMKFNHTSWLQILETGWERFADPIDEASSGSSFVPSLDREWLSEDELPPSASDNATDTNLPNLPVETTVPPEPTPTPVPPVVDERASPPTIAPEGATSFSEGDEGNASGPDTIQDTASSPKHVPTSRYWDEDLPEKRRRKPNPKYVHHAERFIHHANKSVKLRDYDRSVFMNLNWKSNFLQQVPTYYSKMMALLQLATDPFTNEIDGDLHPCLLASKASQADNPTYEEAMNGPHRDGFHEAMVKELKTLTDMECWDVVKRVPGSNVLPSTWAFKMKRFPDGSLSKYKARFCAGGHRQIEGVDFFETFAPVVNWTTVRLLLILSQVLNLSTKQVDYTAAFIHAPINDTVYVEMPRGFSETGKVLKLKKSLYGLKQSPRNFFLHLKENLEACNFHNPSPDTDPCLFVSSKVICVVYVDDTLLWSTRSEWIDEAIQQLQGRGMVLEIEDSVAGFLGVHIERNQTDGSIKLTQAGLIKRIIAALGVEHDPIVHTPTTLNPLVKDEDGDPPDGKFNYASVIGMLGYLQSNSRPDITFAVSSAARFSHNPRRSHEDALKRIGRYLKGTIEEGLVLRPTDNLDIDCYVDADFAGLWPHEDKLDPSCVKSRTGFAICVANCPVVWRSKLQGDIATSTMEAEYTALSMAMRDLLPLRELLIALSPSITMKGRHPTTFRTTVHEDNSGAWSLANLEPGRNTPRSKHYAVKLHWFRSKLISDGPHPIHVVQISTSLQRADILTKGLSKVKFRMIRQLLCGW